MSGPARSKRRQRWAVKIDSDVSGAVLIGAAKVELRLEMADEDEGDGGGGSSELEMRVRLRLLSA